MVGHICHSLKQTENNVKVEELFEDDANYPEPEDATYDKLNDFNEEIVQLKVGLINKSPMGVHALYRNICHLQQYSTAKHLVWAKCVHKSQQKRCNSLKFAQIQEC